LEPQTVSILIPCYNSERWVAQAIKSALAQTWPDKEVIVVDDGSTDGSLNEIKKFEGRIQWETGPNRSGNAARNRLLELARGEWLQYLDADDYLLPEKITNQMKCVASKQDVDVVFSPVTMEYEEATGSRHEVSTIPGPHDLWVLLAHWYLRQTGGALWRKTALFDVGGWNEDQPCCQEHELYLRLLMHEKKFAYCPDAGAIYRQRLENSVSTRDIAAVHRERLKIEQTAEDFLRGKTLLTKERLRAINDARFEIARLARVYDRQLSADIVAKIYNTQPDFQPRGHMARFHYLLSYRLLGFEITERLAKWKRDSLRAFKRRVPA
jgi:glycosyltransferase involved in cell wall biosynthesis